MASGLYSWLSFEPRTKDCIGGGSVDGNEHATLTSRLYLSTGENSHTITFMHSRLHATYPLKSAYCIIGSRLLRCSQPVSILQRTNAQQFIAKKLVGLVLADLTLSLITDVTPSKSRQPRSEIFASAVGAYSTLTASNLTLPDQPQARWDAEGTLEAKLAISALSFF